MTTEDLKLMEERLNSIADEVIGERITAAVKGYDLAHDREHGVHHQLMLSRNYLNSAYREPVDRECLIKAAGLLLAAVDLIDSEEKRE